METTLATIMITATATVVLIGLGAIVWAIVKLGRRVYNLEVLCRGYENEFKNIYAEFENQNRERDARQNEILKRIDEVTESLWRRFEDGERDSKEHREEILRKIDSLHEWTVRDMDKRFDSVYRKVYSIQHKVTTTNPEFNTQGY
jgi:hypothetical protein